jgi:RNA polymerase sigma factor (sigma-70 family)
VSASAAGELIPSTGGVGDGLAFSADERLTRRAARGEKQAFAAIFERHHQELYRYCRALVGNPADAEDALQNAMVAALTALPGEPRGIVLRPWLYRVAHNEAISIIRRRRPVVDAPELADQAADGIDGVVGARQRLRQLVLDLHALPERRRSALVMRELSGLSYRDIASALGATEQAARQLVYEARQTLADLEEGREMDCHVVRRAISDREVRLLRGRGVRAHLRGCEGCRDFRSAISTRRAELQELCPPLPPVAAAGVLATILGGTGGGAAGGAAGGVAAGLAGSGAAAGGGAAGAGVATKAAAVVAAAAIGVGAADVGGIVHLPLSGAGGGSAATPRAPARSAGGAEAAETTTSRDAIGAGSRGDARSGTTHGHHPMPAVQTRGGIASNGSPASGGDARNLHQVSPHAAAVATAPGGSSAPTTQVPAANGAAHSASAPGHLGGHGEGSARSASTPAPAGKSPPGPPGRAMRRDNRPPPTGRAQDLGADTPLPPVTKAPVGKGGGPADAPPGSP